MALQTCTNITKSLENTPNKHFLGMLVVAYHIFYSKRTLFLNDSQTIFFKSTNFTSDLRVLLFRSLNLTKCSKVSYALLSGHCNPTIPIHLGWNL